MNVLGGQPIARAFARGVKGWSGLRLAAPRTRVREEARAPFMVKRFATVWTQA